MNSLFPADDFMQHFYYIWQVESESNKYNLPFLFQLDGKLDESKLYKSLDKVLSYWLPESGGYFTKQNGQLYLAVPKHFKLFLNKFVADDKNDAMAILKAEISKPFNLNTGPLYRTTLITAPDCWYFLLEFQHIIFDTNCLPFMMKTISNCYNNNVQDHILADITQPSLSEWLTMNSVQHATETEPSKSESKAFWTDHIKKYRLSLDLNFFPAACSGTASKKTEVFSKYRFSLSDSETSSLRELCYRLQVTEFFATLAILGVVLNRYTGQNNFAIAYPKNCRPNGYKHTPGCFVNTLPAGIVLPPGATLSEIIHDVTQQYRLSRTYCSYPTLDIIHDYRLTQHQTGLNDFLNITVSKTIFAEQIFNFDGVSCQGGLFGGGVLDDCCSLSAMFDLSLMMDTGQDKTEYAVYYRASVFGPLIVDILSSIKMVINEWLSTPDILWQNLKIYTQDQLIKNAQLGMGRAADIGKQNLVERFKSHVKKQPDLPAIVHTNLSLSFAELDKYSDFLASQIQQALTAKTLQVQTDKRIGVLFPRSPELIASMLAIWKLGYAYVPLDPNTPETFNGQIITASGIDLLFGDENHIKTMSFSGIVKQIVTPFRQVKGELQYPEPQSKAIRNANSLSYIIFTSGSTGKPKGVMIEDRGLLNLADHYSNTFSVSHNDRSSQVSTQSFDAFGYEVWPFLLNGASVAIVPDNIRFKAQELADWLANNQVTVCALTSSLSTLFLSAIFPGHHSLRIVRFGGEKLHSLPDKAFPFMVMNCYGPTEATIEVSFSTLYKPGENLTTKPSSSIGCPIQNVGIHILDEHRLPVPVGVKGELYISGISLMRGYLDDPLQTNKALVSIKLPGTSAKLMYKTGDIGRYLNNGEIEYIDRNDDQIQLRGYRIEPAAIESKLTECSMIENAAVTVKGTGQDAILIAYVVPHKANTIDKKRLIDELSSHCPAHWIPSRFFCVDSLPLTDRGKVDKSKLDQQDVTELENTTSRRENALEEAIARIWGNILQRQPESIDVEGHFYHEGGSSLMLVELWNELESQFAMRFSLEKLVQHNSIRKQACLITQEKTEHAPDWVCFHQSPKGIPVILLPPRGAGLEAYHSFAKQFNKAPVYGIESHNLYCEPFDTITDLRILAARYIKTLKQHMPNGPYKLAGWSMGGNIAQEMARQLELEGLLVAGVYLFDSTVADDKGIEDSMRFEPLLTRIMVQSEPFLALTPKVQHKLLQVKAIEHRMILE
ncbi:MAG: amino acid adenylation domain-containing protein, partial [Shewanella sp.]|nr:amino acid adenylation domain-containing protein [Shewanella sp.]